MLLPPEPQTTEPKYRATTQEQQIFAPTTRAVMQAYASESLTGVGTYQADKFANAIQDAEKYETRLTKEQFDQSPLYRPGMEFYPEITEKSMSLIAQFHDEHATNQEIIARASGAQTAAGMVSGILMGTLEPKNLAIGVATSVALGPILGAISPAVSQAKKIVNLRRANSAVAARAGYGATEGLVAAAIAEPSNRYSAKTLQQDYTVMDTFLNVATSSLLGGAIGAASPMIEARFRREPNKLKAYDTTLVEHDTALNQLAAGHKVDVAHVERVMTGEIATKPIAEKAAAVENFVRYTETPEFKARFEGSKAVDEQGQPLRVYHGTTYDIPYIDPEKSKSGEPNTMYFSSSAETANLYTDASPISNQTPNIQLSYLNIKKPLIYDAKGRRWNNIDGNMRTIDDIVKDARDGGYDGAIIQNVIDDTLRGTAKPATTYAVFDRNNIISAFGADDMDAIARRLDAENKIAVNKSVLDSVNPENDTAIDYAAARALDEYNTTLREDEASIKASFDNYLKEIAFMKQEGLMTDAEIEMFTDAINSVDEKDLQSGYDALLSCLTRG